MHLLTNVALELFVINVLSIFNFTIQDEVIVSMPDNETVVQLKLTVKDNNSTSSDDMKVKALNIVQVFFQDLKRIINICNSFLKRS